MTRLIYDKQRRDFVPVEEYRREEGAAMRVMPDIAPFISPIDGSLISSRTQLREHERVHSVRQCGAEWTGRGSPPPWFPEKAGRG